MQVSKPLVAVFAFLAVVVLTAAVGARDIQSGIPGAPVKEWVDDDENKTAA